NRAPERGAALELAGDPPALGVAVGAVDAGDVALPALDLAHAHVDRAVDAAAFEAPLARRRAVAHIVGIARGVAVLGALLARRAGDRGDAAEDQHACEHVARVDPVVAVPPPPPAPVALGVERIAVESLRRHRARQLDRGRWRGRDHGKGRGDGGRCGQLVGPESHRRHPWPGLEPSAEPLRMRLGGPGLRQPEPPRAPLARERLGGGLRGRSGNPPPGALQPADSAVVEVDHAAVAHVAGEPAGVVAAVAVVPAAPVVAPAAAPVGVAGVDRDAALDLVAVALAVDVADVGHLGAAAPRIAAGVALGGIDALLDRAARAAAAAIAAVVPVVAVVAVAAGGRGHRCD